MASYLQIVLQNKYILVRTGPKANEMNEMVHTRGLLRWSLSLIRCCAQLHYGTVSEAAVPFVWISRLCTGNWTHFRPYKTIPLCNAIQHRPCIVRNRTFAASHSRGTKPLCWNAKFALGQDKQGKLPFKLRIPFVYK